MSRLIIRPIERRDLDFIMHLEEVAYGHAWDQRLLMRLLERKSSLGSVACIDEMCLGYSIIRKMRNARTDERRMYLDSLAVIESVRRQRIGTALMFEIYKYLTPQRSVLETHIFETELCSQLFLRSCGWVAAETLFEEGCLEVFRMIFRREWLETVEREDFLNRKASCAIVTK